MQDIIYIFGHKNPDPDSICAALAYAAFKEAQGETHYVAARCGDITPRVQAVLDLFQVEAPLLVENLEHLSSAAKPLKALKIALVDHNEMTQAVEGAARAHIVEVIDHHRLGTFNTETPIFFHNEPVGSTCTIIGAFFKEKGLIPTSKIVGLLMAGLISDTYLLQSPTTTPKDSQILKWLESLSSTPSQKVFDALFQIESSILNHPAERVINLDSKIFEEQGKKLSVAQVEEAGFEAFWKNTDSLYAALEALRKREDLYAALLLVTDIQKLDSILLVAGDTTFIERIDYKRISDLPVFDLPQVVSRKKQVMPYLSTRLQALKNTQ